MSELKDYSILDIEAIDDERLEKSESGRIQETRVYIKSEADKVIAELETKNASLAEEINEWVQSAANRPIIIGRLRQHIALLDNELSHHKYKRCFKMARWCISMMVFNSQYGTDKKWHHFKKWHERWLVLAEKFKE